MKNLLLMLVCGVVVVSCVEQGAAGDYVSVSMDKDLVVARKNGEGKALFADKDAEKVLEWAMKKSPITLLEKGSYTINDMLDIPRSNIALIIDEDAQLVQFKNPKPTTITEGHGTYRPLIYNKGHDNVKFINLGTLRALRKHKGWSAGIHFDGRSGGDCGIDGGLIFSSGKIIAWDTVWIVDVKNVEIPLIAGRDYMNSPLAIEGCEDVNIGIVSALGGTNVHENEAMDFNSFAERVRVKKVIATMPAEEIVDVNNTRDTVVEEIVVYGNHPGQKIFHIHEYGPTGRRFTQKEFIPDSKGTVCLKERVVKREVKEWKVLTDVEDLKKTLPVVKIKVKIVALFEDGGEETVADESYELDLSSSGL